MTWNIPAAGAAAALMIALGGGMMWTGPGAQAASDNSDKNPEAMAKVGLEIAPVPLNLQNKDKKIVGYGSYLVNAAMGCNDCHSEGPQTVWAPGGNPYFGQKPTKVNPDTYMVGGNDFGPFPAPGFAHIVSRNLTPNGSGDVAGGFEAFRTSLRTGKDRLGRHPNCVGPPSDTCIPAPFDGSLLQIMPWPVYQNLTEYDIRAIYTYLTAISCLEGSRPGRCNP